MTTDRRTFLRATAGAAAAGLIGAERILGEAPLASRAQVGMDRFDPWIEVDSEALAHNVGEVERLSEGRPVLAVVKNNAYGLDLTTASTILEPMAAIAGFAVVKVEAALALRAAGVRKPVYLMALFSESMAPELARHNITPCLSSEDALRLVGPMTRVADGPVDVQIYLDTGMSRMGVSHRRALPWIETLAASGAVRFRGVFTGLTEDPDFDREQVRRLLAVTDKASEAGIDLGLRHAASSSGVFEFPESHLDMVRPGMALYGGYPNDPGPQRGTASLQSAVRLKARVVRLEQIREGDSVSYGRNYVAKEATWIATLPVGHTDGYPRRAVDGGRVLIGDQTYPVIGAVSASHTVLEIGPDPSVAVGDVATLIGSEASDIDPNQISVETGTSIYDLFMHLNPTLPRLVV